MFLSLELKMSRFIILYRLLILTVFYTEYGFAVNDQDLIQQIDDIKSQLRQIQHQDEYGGVIPMAERGIIFESLTSARRTLLMEWPTCLMQLYATVDSLEDKLYRKFIFRNDSQQIEFYDIDIKMFVFYHEMKVKLLLRRADLAIIELTFATMHHTEHFMNLADNESTPGKKEVRLVTVAKFQTYDLSGVECNTYSSVQVDKNIVSDDLVSYALSQVEQGVNRRLLLIFSSRHFTPSCVMTYGEQKVVFIQVSDTLGNYIFVLYFNDANDATNFLMDIMPHRDPNRSILSEGCLSYLPRP